MTPTTKTNGPIKEDLTLSPDITRLIDEFTNIVSMQARIAGPASTG